MSNKANILIVDDEPMTVDVLKRRLEQNGYSTASAHDGVACVEHLKLHRPDLVLMDVAMPGMNGIDCIAELRKTWSLDSLPIIVISAMVDSDDVVTAIDAGANDYIVKPINMKVLMARVAMCLKLKQTVSLLVEAERQRVMIESLGKTAQKLAEPMDRVIDSLESEMRDAVAREDSTDRLQEVADWVEHVVEVLESIQKASTENNVPYVKRQQMLG
jgi:DNA-binding response OmpR family regulator